MTRKKSGFLTFLFSFLPGAGEMYMGFMKQGVTLMGAFFLLIFLASWLNIGALLFVLPVLWCYGFFHVHNLRCMPDDEFYAVEDDYLFHLDQILPVGKHMQKHNRNVLAAILIVIGVAILWDNLGDFLRWFLPSHWLSWYWGVTRRVPTLIVSVALILGGVWLIRGKKRQLDEEEEEKKDGGLL